MAGTESGAPKEEEDPMPRTLRFIPALPFLALGACEDRVAPHPPPNADYALTLAAESADIVRTAREAGSTDEFFALVHDWVPGFAGLMLEDGVPTVSSSLRFIERM